MVKDDAAILEMASLMGGSGKWEEVAEQRVHTIAEGEAFGSGILLANNGPRTTIEYSTVKAGLEPGQKLNVKLPSKGIPDSWFIVDQVSRQSEGVDLGDGSTFRTHVTLASSSMPDWRGLYMELRDRTRLSVPPVFDKHIFWLAVQGGNAAIKLTVGNNVTNPILVLRKGIITDISVVSTTPPEGSSAIFRVKKNAVVVTDADLIVYPALTVLPVHHTNWASADARRVDVDDVLTIDVVAVGATVAGANFTVVVYIARSE
jgi:hypothetical protein